MYSLFVKLLNRSLTAGVLVLVVAAVRLLLHRAPRRLLCLLWLLVALRLVMPVGLSSSLSAFNLFPPRGAAGETSYFHYNEKPEKPKVSFSAPALVSDRASADSAGERRTPEAYLPAVMELWLVGAAAMLICAFAGMLSVRRQTAASLSRGEGVYVSDDISTPFILGILRPGIFLPSGMDGDTAAYVLAHERMHLRRRDHWWKPLGYLLLSLHWFNPALWLGYVLFCRDLELACDEAVAATLTRPERAAYSRALLECASPRRMVTACPLAFGEVGVKTRVRGVLNYRKSGARAVVMAAMLCAVAAVCFLTDPVPAAAYDRPDGASREPAAEQEPEHKDPLTLEDVIVLSERGEALGWADFEGFACTEAGFGLYIRIYAIDDVFSLWIGGTPDREPMYIYLKADGEQIDIRREAVRPFIDAHRSNAQEQDQG